jgi:fatty-acyl-CoA synthase
LQYAGRFVSQSYVRGREAALLEQSIHTTFTRAVNAHPERAALVSVHQNLHFTYAELHEQVERTARGFAGLGLGPGDRIGIWATNCAEWVMVQLAAARAGILLVNINPAYRVHELEYALVRSRIQAIFLKERDERSNYREILDEAARRGGVTLDHRVYLDTDSWGQFLDEGRDYPHVDVAPGDLANMQYTSGTTGSPKGVLLTHRGLVNNGLFIGKVLKVTEQDRICVPVPLYHCFGCVIGTMVAINVGAAMILPNDRFHALPTMQALERERCTLVYGVPTMFIAQINHAEFPSFNFSALRGGIMSGAPCPVEIMKRVMTEMHCPEITIVYGQTESSPVITGSMVDDPIERRVSTVGFPLHETEVKLIDSKTGETVPVGTRGEICTRGYLVMKGYDGDEAATREVVDEDGWLHTGDLGILHEDGYIHLTGRVRDVIIRGGENVYPKEVEEFLYRHPKVAAVEVVGVPDYKLGEAVLAWIRLKPGVAATEEEIREFCRGEISHFKIPQYVRFVDEFPATANGKTQKYLIRQRDTELREAAEMATA